MKAFTTLPRVSSGDGNDRGVGDRRMLDEAVLDLRGADPVSRRLEHVVRAALVPEVTVGVALREIAGAAPVAGELPRGSLRVLEVFEEEDGVRAAVGRDAMDGDLSDLVHADFAAVVVDRGDAVSGIRATHRPRLRRPQFLGVADDIVHFGLAEHFVDRDAERIARPLENRGPDSLARAHDGPQAQIETLTGPRTGLHHQLERGRKQECIADAVFLHQRERAFGIEPPAIADDRLAEIECREAARP